MPLAAESAPVSSVLGVARADVNRHVFRGGNFLLPRVLNRFRGELGVEATAAELEATSRRSVEHLQTNAARIHFADMSRSGDSLLVDVVVENLAGHKLPTAYPSRRVWIHFSVSDASGNVVFESGALRRDGAIEGNANDMDGTGFEPHYATITSPDQVQIYEAILTGVDGEVTTGLTTALSYVKDNRVLPKGFDKETAGEDIAVHGAAASDDDFTSNGDRTRYVIVVDDLQGPCSVNAELWYQPIGYRWAENLREYEAMEPQRFVRYFEDVSGSSAVMLAHHAAETEVR
jgi:hypothetical protein